MRGSTGLLRTTRTDYVPKEPRTGAGDVDLGATQSVGEEKIENSDRRPEVTRNKKGREDLTLIRGENRRREDGPFANGWAAAPRDARFSASARKRLEKPGSAGRPEE